MDKLDFMNIVKDILEETEGDLLFNRAEEMKNMIDVLVKQEVEFENKGLR